MNRVEGQKQVIELIKAKYKLQGRIDDKDVYEILNNFGLTEEDKQVRVKKHLFDFKGEIRTRGVIVSAHDISFVPFSNNIDDRELIETSLKMYISVPAKKLMSTYESLNKFITKNNIKSNSKARNRASNDDIVIRVPDIIDAEKIRHFIEKSDIKNSIIMSNPFFAHDDLGISYAMDGIHTSANDILAKYLSSYVNKNNIDDISREGFKEYLHNEKTNTYRKFPNISFYQIESDRIRNLIELSMDEDFNYEKMINYVLLMQNFKNTLKGMNINDINLLISSDLNKKYDIDNVINMMGNIEDLEESDFSSPIVHLLSRIYLTKELTIDYLTSLSRDDLAKNNKKYV